MKKAILFFLLLTAALLCFTACQVKPCQEHSFAPWSVLLEPSCTEEGQESRKCRLCDYSETREIPMLDHTLVLVEGKLPTCGEEGISNGAQCAVCQAWLTPQEILAMKEHTYLLTEDKSFYVLSDQNERYCCYCQAFIAGSQIQPDAADKEDGLIGKYPFDYEIEIPIRDKELFKEPVDILDKDKIEDFLDDWIIDEDKKDEILLP